MSELITDNIDRIGVYPLKRPLGWEVTFRSSNDALHHQLYVNGRLIDFTDHLEQRSFEITAETAPLELAIAAVSGAFRMMDLSDELPEYIRHPGWVYRASVARHVDHHPGDLLGMFDDKASGTMEQDPSLLREIWPPSVPHWGWGCCEFARGAFGVDGSYAPGFGGGAYGLGPFGINADRIQVDLALAEEGAHQIELRVLSAQDQLSDPEEVTFPARVPPAPADTIQPTAYDTQTYQLTLQIN